MYISTVLLFFKIIQREVPTILTKMTNRLLSHRLKEAGALERVSHLWRIAWRQKLPNSSSSIAVADLDDCFPDVHQPEA
jgi:hypothetical protein